MTLYYETSRMGKCGCRNWNYYVTDEYKTKAELKRASIRNIKKIWTEEQAPETVKANAKPW